MQTHSRPGGQGPRLRAPLPTRPRPRSAPHTRAQLFLDPLTSLDLVGPPSSFPPRRPRASPSCPGAGTRPPTWAGAPRRRAPPGAPRGSSRNALGLFLRLPSSRAERRDPGRHHKVSLKSPSRGPPPAPAPAPARSSRGAAQDCARAARGPRWPLGRTAALQDSRRQMACGGRLRGGWRRPSLLPFPLPPPRRGARTFRGAGRDLPGGCGSGARPASGSAGISGKAAPLPGLCEHLRRRRPGPGAGAVLTPVLRTRPWQLLNGQPAPGKSRGTLSAGVSHSKVVTLRLTLKS